MNSIKQFHRGVYNQARIAGYDKDVASRVAAMAVASRLTESDGVLVAQTSDFTNQATKLYKFDIKSVRVDQAEGNSVIVDAILASPETDIAGQSFSDSALRSFANQINTDGIGGFLDEHKAFRDEGERNKAQSVTEWVKARVEGGRLWITAKMKAGYEWVVNKFHSLSLEAAIPVTQALMQGHTKKFFGGTLKGFVFTNRPKQPMNRITNVRAA